MPDITELQVKISGDSKDAEGAVQRVMGSISAFADVVKRGFEFGAGWSIASDVLNKIGDGFGAMKAAAIDFNASLEQSRIGWETMLGGAQQAQDMLNQLEQFAATTPFEFPELEQDAKELLAMGFDAQQLIPILTDVGNVASSMGGDIKSNVDIITRALGQMHTATVIHAQDMLQLTSVGVPAWQILADAIGKTTKETQDLASQGKISADVFIDAFAQWSQTHFGDAMDKESHTFLGALSTIKDELRLTTASAFKPFFDMLSSTANRIADFVQGERFREFGEDVSVVVGGVIRALGSLADAFATVFVSILQTVETVGQLIYEALQWINPFAPHSPPLVNQVNDGLSQIKEAFGGLVDVGEPLATVGSDVKGLEKTLQGVVSNAKDKLSDLKQQLQDAQNAVQQFIQGPLIGEGALKDQVIAQEKIINAIQQQQDAKKAANSDTLVQIANEQRLLDMTQALYPSDKKDIDAHQQRIDLLKAGYDNATQLTGEQATQLQQAKDQLTVLQDQQQAFSLQHDTLQRVADSATTVENSYDAAFGGILSNIKKEFDLAPQIDKGQQALDTLQGALKDVQAAAEKAGSALKGIGGGGVAGAGGGLAALNDLKNQASESADIRARIANGLGGGGLSDGPNRAFVGLQQEMDALVQRADDFSNKVKGWKANIDNADASLKAMKQDMSFSSIAEGIAHAFEHLDEAVLKEGVPAAERAGEGFASAIANAMVGAIQHRGGQVSDVLMKMMDFGMSGGLPALVEKWATELAGGFLAGIVKRITGFDILSTLSGMQRGIDTFALNLNTTFGAGGSIGQAFSTFGKTINDFLTTAQTTWDKIWSGMGKGFSDTWNGIIVDAKDKINQIIGFIDRLIGAFDSLKFTFPAVNIDAGPLQVHWGGESWSVPYVPQVPLLDTGGIVRGPGLVAVGPIVERFTPLSGPYARGEGQAINVNFYGNVYGFDDFQDKVVLATETAGRRLRS